MEQDTSLGDGNSNASNQILLFFSNAALIQVACSLCGFHLWAINNHADVLLVGATLWGP